VQEVVARSDIGIEVEGSLLKRCCGRRGIKLPSQMQQRVGNPAGGPFAQFFDAARPDPVAALHRQPFEAREFEYCFPQRGSVLQIEWRGAAHVA
jgi:hypothetical protein